jgi:hypothetical protein
VISVAPHVFPLSENAAPPGAPTFAAAAAKNIWL